MNVSAWYDANRTLDGELFVSGSAPIRGNEPSKDLNNQPVIVKKLSKSRLNVRLRKEKLGISQYEITEEKS